MLLLCLQKLTRGQDNWSLSEVMHALILLAHFHSLCSFVSGCDIRDEEIEDTSHSTSSNNNVQMLNCNNVSFSVTWSLWFGAHSVNLGSDNCKTVFLLKNVVFESVIILLYFSLELEGWPQVFRSDFSWLKIIHFFLT